MKAKKKALILLLVLLAVAVAVFVLLTRANAGRADSESSAEGDIVLSSFSTEKLTSIEYVQNGETLSLAQADGTWTLSDDPEYHVGQTAVNSMAAALCGLTAKRKIENVTDYSQYGLETPGLTVTAQVADTKLTFSFGDTNSITGDVYLMMKGDTNVYTVAAAKQNCFSYDKAGLYDTSYSPVTIAKSDIQGIAYYFQDSSEEFTVALKAVSEPVESDTADSAASDGAAEYETVWHLAGSSDTLRQDDVNTMLAEITAAPTGQITNPGDLAQYGLDNPLITVQLTGADGTAQTLSLGVGTEGYYLMEQGDTSVYTVAIDVLNAFSVTGDELKLTGSASSTAISTENALSDALDPTA